MFTPRKLELLAPARDAATALSAISHGTDAIYIGAPTHGARSAATNTIADIARVVETAHQFGVRVYVTVNTIIYDSEITAVEQMIAELYRIGVDALIVQDLGLLRAGLPPIELHASTQCDIATPEKATFLASLGFSQLVLARELSISETARIHAAVPDTPLEAFIHGALCVSYSGNCQAGFAIAGRSANRGECPQICRLPWTLTDGDGRTIASGKHLLSLRDLNRSASLAEMIEAGVSSFKIEGRLKDASYVKNVTAHYRRLLDDIIEHSEGRYCRSSFGKSKLSFTPDISESFNRGFTSYFTHGIAAAGKMASFDTPKWAGRKVAKVVKTDGRKIIAKISVELNNGDGLGYFDSEGTFRGFRVNRVEGNVLHLKEPITLRPGTELFRNHNRLFAGQLERPTAVRKISLTQRLRPLSGADGIALEMSDERGARASVAMRGEFEEAHTPQSHRHRDILAKLGDTIFESMEITDDCTNLFIPAGMLTQLRRDTLEALNRSWKAIFRQGMRKEPTGALQSPSPHLTYHDNIANHLSKKLMEDCSVKSIEPALEAMEQLPRQSLQVMTTRYCLRRELGACLRTTSGKFLKEPLRLTNGNLSLRLDFDCRRCGMNIFLER